MIFISYRRAEADDHAGRLIDRLLHWFDPDAIFYDKNRNSIDMGDDFPAEIEAGLERATAVLVLIGPKWLDKLNRQANEPRVDYVRRELAGALKRSKPVFPILLGGAMPIDTGDLDENLRPELAPLCALDVHRFPDSASKLVDYDHKFVQLRDKLATVPGVPVPRFRLPSGAVQPRRLIDHQLSPHFRDPNALLPQLHALLAADGSSALVARAALYGMGGVGKTQLALKYSLDYPDHYAGIWWFRAETEATLQLDAEACCTTVDAPIGRGETPSAALKRWLDRESAPWLLVYDNAEHADSLRPHLPQAHTHRILVTSRDPAWGGLLKHALSLETWTSEQGAVFLAERLPGRAPEELRALAEDLGGLPLALEQAAGYIESTGIAVVAYRKLLAEVDTEGLILDEGRAATGYERSVLATLSLAFDKLTPAAAQLLRLLAFAAPEAFPTCFLREAANELPTELAAATANDLSWNRVVGELRGYGLATVSSLPATALALIDEPALSLHRLTQQVLRCLLAQGASDCAALQSVLHAACPTDTKLPKHWPRFAALLPHVTHLDRYLDTGWLDRRRHTWLLDRTASYLQNGPVPLYALAKRWFLRAMELDRTDLGEEHPHTLTSMSNLASILQAQGDLDEARRLEESALAIGHRMLGEEHPHTLTSMNNLAGTLQAQGDLAGARALQESVLATIRLVLGEEHPNTLTSMNNLASTLNAQGDLAGARALQESALATRRRVLGEEHPDTLTSMNSLANTLQAQGDLTGARALQESVLATRRRSLGEEHRSTLISIGSLALNLEAQGDLTGARALQESELAICRRMLGDEHPDTLDSINNLASTLQAQGDLVGARALQESVLATRRRVVGEEHPDTLVSMNNLSSILHAQGDLARARALQESELAICHRVLGEEHPLTDLSAWNLFATLLKAGDHVAARPVFDTYLQPMLRRDPDTLGADLRTIQEQLSRHLAKTPPQAAAPSPTQDQP